MAFLVSRADYFEQPRPSQWLPHFLGLHAVDILVLTSDTFLLNFAIPRRAVDANVEDHATPEGWEKELLSEGFGEGLRRALRLGA